MHFLALCTVKVLIIEDMCKILTRYCHCCSTNSPQQTQNYKRVHLAKEYSNEFTFNVNKAPEGVNFYMYILGLSHYTPHMKL